LAAIEGDYNGPKLDPDGKVTVEFTEQLMAVYKDQQKLHRRYAYQVYYVFFTSFVLHLLLQVML